MSSSNCSSYNKNSRWRHAANCLTGSSTETKTLTHSSNCRIIHFFAPYYCCAMQVISLLPNILFVFFFFANSFSIHLRSQFLFSVYFEKYGSIFCIYFLFFLTFDTLVKGDIVWFIFCAFYRRVLGTFAITFCSENMHIDS